MRRGVAFVASAAAAAALALAASPTPLAVGPGPLVGVAGPRFRASLPGASICGPLLASISSDDTGDGTYTFLSPGTDGGLITGSYQSEPSPAFDVLGNSLATKIIQPTPFFGVDTATSDWQTGTAVPAPSITTDALGNLTGNRSAVGASWNKLEFNQGSPKADGSSAGGSSAGITAGPIRTHDSLTGAYTLNWPSAIAGGPFNGFAGDWRLAGTFAPAVADRPVVSSVTPDIGLGAGRSRVQILSPRLRNSLEIGTFE